MSLCIFRKLYGRGSKCRCKAISSELYCNRHKDNHNYIFEVMDKALSGRIITLRNELYDLYTYIYDNDIYETFYYGSEDDDEENGKNIFTSTVCYLFTKMQLESLIQNTLHFKRNTTKSKIISILFDIFKNTHSLSKDIDAINKIIKIQRFYRRWLYNNICIYNEMECKNDVDPFTYESIKDIPFENRFGYKDSSGHIYIFDAIEFEYFVRTNGAWNPYTKEPLSDKIIRRLYLIIKHNKLVPKANNNFHWMTPLHAYTDVSHVMEKMGFYNNVTWFEKISYTICLNVIKVYRNICKDIPNVSMFFPPTFKISEENFIFEFCKETIKMFKEADNHFLLCCNFIKAISLYIDEFYHNLPIWLLNIESLITFPDTQLSMLQYRDEDDYNNHIDGVFLLYIQTILEDIV